MTSTRRVLEQGTRCLLAFDARRGPLVVPMAYWYDGDALWMTTARDTLKARLLERDGQCAVYVPAGQAGVLADGSARVLSVRDPLGLLLRAPAITGAMAGLALRNPATLLGYARDAVQVPLRWAPQNRVVLRVAVTALAPVPGHAVPPGVAPPLPAAVPADIRRVLAGQRRVAIAYRTPPTGVAVEPGSWDGRFGLTSAFGGGPLLVEGPVSVAVDADPGTSPLGVRGLVLHGRAEGGVLHPERATFWRGFDLRTVDVGPARTGIVLPD